MEIVEPIAVSGICPCTRYDQSWEVTPVLELGKLTDSPLQISVLLATTLVITLPRTVTVLNGVVSRHVGNGAANEVDMNVWKGTETVVGFTNVCLMVLFGTVEVAVYVESKTESLNRHE